MLKIELNHSGIEQLLKSSEMAQAIKGIADEKCKGCGAGYETDLKVMSTRVVSAIFTASKEAESDNFKNNTLLKAVGR